MCDELREGEIESLPLPKDRAESVRHAVLNVVGIVKLRVASCRYDAAFRHNPREPPKVAGPLQRIALHVGSPNEAGLDSVYRHWMESTA